MEKQKVSKVGIGLIFGTAIGGGLGMVLFNQIALGAAMGAGLGIVFGAILEGLGNKPAQN